MLASCWPSQQWTTLTLWFNAGVVWGASTPSPGSSLSDEMVLGTIRTQFHFSTNLWGSGGSCPTSGQPGATAFPACGLPQHAGTATACSHQTASYGLCCHPFPPIGRLQPLHYHARKPAARRPALRPGKSRCGSRRLGQRVVMKNYTRAPARRPPAHMPAEAVAVAAAVAGVHVTPPSVLAGAMVFLGVWCCTAAPFSVIAGHCSGRNSIDIGEREGGHACGSE